MLLKQHRQGFTLIELMIVATILFILASITTITINPQEINKKARDAKRIQEITSLDQILRLAESRNLDMGEKEIVYISLPDDSPTCTTHLASLPILNAPYQYRCASQTDFRKVNGEGWIPVDFTQLASEGFSLPILPIDPVNSAQKQKFYFYIKGSFGAGFRFEDIGNVKKFGGGLFVIGPGGKQLVAEAGVDTTPPEQKDTIILVVLDVFPVSDSKDVSVEGTEISITLFKKIAGDVQELDRPIDFASIPKNLFKINPAVAGSIALSDSGDTIIFKPSEPLKFGEIYFVEGIGETIIKLNDGTPAHIQPWIFYFTTQSNLIKTVTPAGRSKISLNQDVVVEFLRPMDPTSINEETFGVYSSYLTKVPGTITVSADKLSARFTPIKHLPPLSTVRIDFPKGGIRSATGEKLAAWQQFSFTTGSGLVDIIPAIDDINIPINTQIKARVEVLIKQIDSVLIYKGKIGDILVGKYKTGGIISPDKLAITVTLPDLLEPETQYWININYIFESDMESYAFTRFTTEKKLEVISSSPRPFETHAGASSVNVEFSIPIDPHSIDNDSFDIRYANDGSRVTGSFSITPDGLRAIFSPDAAARERLIAPDKSDIINVTLSADQKKIVSPSGQILPLTKWSYATGVGPRRYNLDIIFSGAASGWVKYTPDGRYCGTTTCSAIFDPSTQVVLTATTTHPTSSTPTSTSPGGGFFAGWSGACSGTGDCTVVMNADKSVTATFHRVVEVTVGGNGHIATTPEGNIGSDTATEPTRRTLVIPSATRDKSFTIVAKDGYVIDEIIVNGNLRPGPFDQQFTYTFDNLSDYQSIKATFKEAGSPFEDEESPAPPVDCPGFPSLASEYFISFDFQIIGGNSCKVENLSLPYQGGDSCLWFREGNLGTSCNALGMVNVKVSFTDWKWEMGIDAMTWFSHKTTGNSPAGDYPPVNQTSEGSSVEIRNIIVR